VSLDSNFCTFSLLQCNGVAIIIPKIIHGCALLQLPRTIFYAL